MIEVCEGEYVSAVCVIYYPKAQLMIFQPQVRDYRERADKTTITTLSHTDHIVNILPINSIGIFSLIC